MANERYAKLPEPVRLEDTVEMVDTTTPPDPEAGKNTDIDFMIRYVG